MTSISGRSRLFVLAFLCAAVATPIVQSNAMGLVHSSVLLLLVTSPGLFVLGLFGVKPGVFSLIFSLVVNSIYYYGVMIAIGSLLRSRQ